MEQDVDCKDVPSEGWGGLAVPEGDGFIMSRRRVNFCSTNAQPNIHSLQMMMKNNGDVHDQIVVISDRNAMTFVLLLKCKQLL